eukprot:gene7642-8483_t
MKEIVVETTLLVRHTTSKDVRRRRQSCIATKAEVLISQLHNLMSNQRHKNSIRDVAKNDINYLDNVEDSSDFICYDRYGQPILRKQAKLVQNNELRDPDTRFLTIGIPTIERSYRGKKEFYLTRTLKSLLENLSEDAKKEVKIVIFCGDEEADMRKSILEKIEMEFSSYLNHGLIDIIYAPARYYKKLDNLPLNYNNTPTRVRWRSKQALDYAFMLYYSSGQSRFYMHLEDDIESKAGFYKVIKDEANKRSTGKDNWIIRGYYRMGFIGKLIPTEYTRLLADLYRIYYYQMPLDWLHHNFIGVVNGGGKESMSNNYLFRHIGKQSSSKNKE